MHFLKALVGVTALLSTSAVGANIPSSDVEARSNLEARTYPSSKGVKTICTTRTAACTTAKRYGKRDATPKVESNIEAEALLTKRDAYASPEANAEAHYDQYTHAVAREFHRNFENSDYHAYDVPTNEDCPRVQNCDTHLQGDDHFKPDNDNNEAHDHGNKADDYNHESNEHDHTNQLYRHLLGRERWLQHTGR
ncbi:unnamed protein product [Zymoseptoria tritici ST99CH_1A5]|uniref:SCP domain-containing protein n=1 Tax=Zymoseptoria tritici ST99CH_1A5 TaxID=1276529 RepID=A0A1Y6LC78_ZYMTR|nr:unnamed protein product [Zymoseptoria tritici ST99CH_1A5]